MHSSEYIADFGMDSISLAGPLAAKLRAIKEAGFSQVMLAAHISIIERAMSTL